jgi:hypothetical protein
MLRRYRPSERPTIPFAQAASNNGKLGLWRRNRPPSLMLLSWPPHRGERTSDAQAGSDERVPARAVPPLSSPLASSTHSTAPLDRTLKAPGITPNAIASVFCCAPVRRKVEAPKIQHPRLLLGYLQDATKAANEFSADRDTKATLRSRGR